MAQVVAKKCGPGTKMRALKASICIALSILVIVGCDRSTPTLPTAVPSPPTPTQPSPSSIVLTGQVTDAATSAPVAGAIVRINGRYPGVTDASGKYSVTGLLDAGEGYNFTFVSAADYVSDYRYIRSSTQDVRLHRIERITAGESKIVTVAPADTLCVNNMQDSPGLDDHVCRSVRVVVLSDGIVTIEAVSMNLGAHPPLEVETVGVQPCCSERMGNPTSIQVRAGTEIVANIEMSLGSTVSQSFVLTTSIAR